MPKDQLFLLQPGFFKESEGPFYCGDSVAVEGLLSFFPQLRNEVDVHYIGAPRPRAAIVALSGADNQSAPVLVLGHGREVSDAGVEARTHNGVRFIDAPDQIRRYLSAQYGVAHAS